MVNYLLLYEYLPIAIKNVECIFQEDFFTKRKYKKIKKYTDMSEIMVGAPS